MKGILQKISPAISMKFKATPNEISIELEVTHDYLKVIPGTNCYFFTILLLTWAEDAIAVDHFKQKSGWIKVPSKPHRLYLTFQSPNQLLNGCYA